MMRGELPLEALHDKHRLVVVGRRISRKAVVVLSHSIDNFLRPSAGHATNETDQARDSVFLALGVLDQGLLSFADGPVGLHYVWRRGAEALKR